MARLERGKGKRGQVITIAQHGRMLSRRENAGGDLRLPGYRRCATPELARATLEAEVRRLLDDGMRAADPEAQAIADAMAAAVPAGPPTLPVRCDLGIYNEANGFVVTSRRMAGKALDEGTDAWKKAVQKGDLLPLTLVQDDPFVIRVVAGEPLTAQEEEEWVARVDWHLNISDGLLCVTGGAVFSSEDYDADDPYYEQYVGEVALPKGRYRARLYTQVHGVNGGAVLDELAGGEYGSGEPLDAWWVRTRPDEPAPVYDDETDLVGFLLHLEPIDKAPKSGLSAVNEDGWFGGAENARKPERCPRGLVGRDVIRRQREDHSGWTFVRDVRELLGARRAKPMRGGPLAIPIAELPLVARLAWFASRWVVFELEVSRDGVGDLTAIEWPEGMIASEEGDAWRLLLDSDVPPAKAVPLFADVAAVLASLPDGTRVALLSAPAGPMSDGPGDEGAMITEGELRDGQWLISGVFPSVDAARFGEALALAREAGAGTTLATKDAAEADAIIARAKQEFGHQLEDDPPKAKEGAIRFKKGGWELLFTAAAAFALRFGQTWPVVTTGSFDDDDDEDELTVNEPIRGLLIWTAPDGREYFQSMALMISDDVASTAQARERALVARGIGHYGDLFCPAYPGVAVRGYAKDGGTMWGFFHCSAPDNVDVQLVTFFEGGLLVTSADATAADRPEAKLYQTGLGGANTRDLLEAHDQRAAELATTLGAPRPTERKMAAFAAALDAVMRARA